MKIAIIAHTHYPIREPFPGGLEAHTFMLVKELQARGHVVTLFATPQSDSSLPIEPIHDDLLTVDYTLLPQMRSSEEQNRFHQEHHAYQKLMLRLRESDFDVVHNNSVHYLPISMGPLLPMPIVTVLHTPPFAWLQSAVQIERPSHKMHYILPSQALLKQWKPYLDDAEVVYNGVDMNRWPFNETPENYAAWTGRLVPEKGAHFAIEAAQRTGIKLLLAGPIQDRAYFEAEVEPRLSGEVNYIGHLDHDAMVELIAKASIFLATPCWEEPFGLTVAEALACGTPVVAFNRGAMPELVAQGAGKVVEANNARAMAEAIPDIIRNCSRKTAHRVAENFFSLRAMVDGYEAAYLRLQSNTSAPAQRKTRAQ